MINTFFLYQSNDDFIQNNLKEHSSSYHELNFSQELKTSTLDIMHTNLDHLLTKKNITHLFILQDNCDSSLNLAKLYSMKIRHQMKIIFTFKEAQNSFEFIDRYYAQIADLVILNPLSYINDFYKMLEIPTITLEDLNVNLTIRKKNVFSSSLVNLSTPQKIQTDYTKFKDIFNSIENLKPNFDEPLTDKKFIYTQGIYEIYWSLYHIILHNNFKLILKLLNIKYIMQTIRLYKILKNSQTLSNDMPIDLINEALYREHTL